MLKSEMTEFVEAVELLARETLNNEGLSYRFAGLLDNARAILLEMDPQRMSRTHTSYARLRELLERCVPYVQGWSEPPGRADLMRDLLRVSPTLGPLESGGKDASAPVA